MGKRNSCHTLTVELLGQFRAEFPQASVSKQVLSAKQVIWKSFLVWWRWTSLSQKGFALSLVLKVTVFGTWKWPIEQWAHDELHFGIPVEQNNPSHLKETRLITVHDNVLLQFTAARLITIYDNVQGFLCNNEFTAGHFIQLFSKLWPNFSPFRATFVSGIEIWSKRTSLKNMASCSGFHCITLKINQQKNVNCHIYFLMLMFAFRLNKLERCTLWKVFDNGFKGG